MTVGSVSKLDLFCKNIIVVYGDILCKPISNKNVSSNATRCIHGKLINIDNYKYYDVSPGIVTIPTAHSLSNLSTR